MHDKTKLPPGQFERDDFPRFGLTQYADRFPKETQRIEIRIGGDVEAPAVVAEELRQLPRVEQISDLHCVTTWSKRSLRWGGVRFADFFEHIVVPASRPHADATFVILRCQDGYRTSLPLADLMNRDVLLVDTLDGAPLPIEHGAPLRLIAPAHYGYKNPKHLDRIEFWRDDRHYRPAGGKFIDHPRARVHEEERGRFVPGWILRYLYRPLIGRTVARSRQELEKYRSSSAASKP